MNQIENDNVDELAVIPPSLPRSLEVVLCCTHCKRQFREVINVDAGAELRCSGCEQILLAMVPIIGVVYVLSNESMPGLVKIGQTSRKIDERLRELSISTGVPLPFSCDAIFNSANPNEDEQRIHQRLSAVRVSDNREFFRLKSQEAVDAIKNILGRLPIDGIGNSADQFSRLWQPKRP